MAVTARTGDRLEKIALELEWLEGRLLAEGHSRAASSLREAKGRVDAAGQEVKREIARRATRAA